MKTIDFYIQEKLVIKNDSSIRKFTDEELDEDYNKVWSAITKKEKEVIANKYGITEIRIRPIQIGILDLLRKNRKNKKEFTDKDIVNFFRYDIPDTYNKFEDYLKEESDEFVKYLLKRYKEKIDEKNIIGKFGISIADRHLLKIYDNIKKYIESNRIL